MPDLESALAAISAEIGAAQKTVDALSKLLKRLRQAAEVGHIGDLEKLLAQAAPLGRDAESAVRGLTDAWSFDTKAHLNDHYADELRDEAERQEVRLFERDGRLFAFPLYLTIDSDEAALRIGSKLERRIRPRSQSSSLQSRSGRRDYPSSGFLICSTRYTSGSSGRNGARYRRDLGPLYRSQRFIAL